jgi:hypothetical protein
MTAAKVLLSPLRDSNRDSNASGGGGDTCQNNNADLLTRLLTRHHTRYLSLSHAADHHGNCNGLRLYMAAINKTTFSLMASEIDGRCHQS